MNSGSQTCYLGLGSNLGNKHKNLLQAIHHIKRLNKTRYAGTAPWFASKAWGVANQPTFLNTVIKIETQLKPLQLLKELKVIEYRLMQRKLNKKWHSRNIDIDILLYGRQVINKPQLKIPHPFIAERCFVIAPLLHFRAEFNAQLRKNITKHQYNHNCNDSLLMTQLGDMST